MCAQSAHTVGKFDAVRERHATFAGGNDFDGMEAEDGDVAVGAGANFDLISGLPPRFAPRNDGFSVIARAEARGDPEVCDLDLRVAASLLAMALSEGSEAA